MEFAEAAALVAEIPQPHIPAHRGRRLYQHIRKSKPDQVLELGTARGGSALFIAAALEANGKGHLTTVESTRWTFENPTPREVLDRSGLAHRVTLDRSSSTYTWFLKERFTDRLADNGVVDPIYDLVFLDGSKNWSTDGLAVILIERLMRPGGWLLLDDLGWTYEKHAPRKDRHYEIDITSLSDAERTEPHLSAIFDLFVKRNPAFSEWKIDDDGWWGWARKSPTGAAAVIDKTVNLRDTALKVRRRARTAAARLKARV